MPPAKKPAVPAAVKAIPDALPGWTGVFAARPRLLVAVAVGLAVGAATWLGRLSPSTCSILAWDSLCVSYIATMVFYMSNRPPEEMRGLAARDDQGRVTILSLVVVAAIASVLAVALELSQAKQSHGLVQGLRIALAFVTVAVSWFMVHLIFALHYAHGYYDCDAAAKADVGGLLFPGKEAPDYWDFLHFAVIIGVASQTADVQITSKQLRRLSTVHSVFAFAFNTVIVALTINLLAGLFS
jgi:uncharacterized membrane protein